MIDEYQNRLKFIAKAVDNWLHSGNPYLERAKKKTVQEGFFNASDVEFALSTLKETVNRECLEAWAERAGLSDNNDAYDQDAMCLHAGNIPLVGLQDVLAVLLSGARYTGKISRKDPYLLPTFLNEVKKTKIWSDVDVQWSHNLSDFEGMHSDAILFAGSEESVPDVVQALDRLELNHNNPRKLIRTAHFSLAFFDENTPENLRDLTEGILRYGGSGCRSVAGVVSPIPFSQIKEDLVHSFHQFWEDNPQHQKPQEKLRQQFAYNEAVGNSQAWLNHFLIQEGISDALIDFTCSWVQGDEQTVADLAGRYGGQLQSIYVTQNKTEIPAYTTKTELLSEAQKPPVYWKPDGVDTLAWFCGKDHSS